jgi:hypothetical protein
MDIDGRGATMEEADCQSDSQSSREWWLVSMWLRQTTAPVRAKCFLCESEALAKDTDYGNCVLYRCTNPDYGDYEISRTAMSRLEHLTERKHAIRDMARQYRGTGRIVEVNALVLGEISIRVQPSGVGDRFG